MYIAPKDTKMKPTSNDNKTYNARIIEAPKNSVSTYMKRDDNIKKTTYDILPQKSHEESKNAGFNIRNNDIRMIIDSAQNLGFQTDDNEFQNQPHEHQDDASFKKTQNTFNLKASMRNIDGASFDRGISAMK